MKKKLAFERVIEVCDECGKERGLLKCDYCGKDVCIFCRAVISYVVPEPVRGYVTTFAYQKVMCLNHLPGGKV